MTRAEQQRRWDKFKRTVKNSDLLVSANVYRAEMAKIAVAFGLENGIVIAADTQLWDKLSLSQKSVSRSKRLIGAVEVGTLGMRFTRNDIDIMAPPGMTDDEIAEYQQLGWVLIVVGVVVLAAAIAYAAWVDKENKQIKTDFNNLLYTSDQKFCADPNSDICQKWIARKQQSNFVQKRGLIEQLESGISDVADKAKTGFGVGLAIAIPLIAWSLFGRERKR